MRIKTWHENDKKINAIRLSPVGLRPTKINEIDYSSYAS
jgi:hypothetical protein